MASVDFTTSNPAGSTQAGTDLALKVFSGEVLTAFAGRNVFLPLVNTRTISSGKSAQFPVIGAYADSDVAAHTPGTDITINNIAGGEQTISIASRQYASVFVDEFEEAMSHYEVRGQYSTEIGNALAAKVDKAVVAQLDACASATPATGQPAVNADITLGATFAAGELVGAIFDAVSDMEAKNIQGDKVCVVTPKAYYELVQDDKAINRDFTNGGNGGIDTGSVFNIAGVPIMMSNNITSGMWGYVFTPAAVGVVKLMDIKSEANYIPEKLGTLMTSSYAMGEGVLNAGCSVRLSQS